MNKALLERQTIHDQPLPSISLIDLPMYEHRYLPRWAITARAYYCSKHKAVAGKARIKDLNSSGVSLYLSPVVNRHQELKLKIYLSKKVSFEAHGTVIWKRTLSDQHCCVGVMFDDLPEEVQDLILEYAFMLNEENNGFEWIDKTGVSMFSLDYTLKIDDTKWKYEKAL